MIIQGSSAILSAYRTAKNPASMQQTTTLAANFAGFTENLGLFEMPITN